MNGTSPADEREPAARWQAPVVCLFLALAVWMVFGQTRSFDFVNYDDDRGVYENPVVKQGLSWSGVKWAFTHTHNDNWLPLTVISHELDCRLFGLDPAGHHLTSVALHALTAMLLFLLLRSMTGALWRSALVAAVFAVHPLRVESVAWVAERKDVLSGLFFVLTLMAYVRYVHHRSAGFYLLSVLLFALGLMSKPMLVTLPFILLLVDYWPLRRTGWKFLVLEKIPFALLSAAACVATVVAQRGGMQTVQEIDFPARIANAIVSYAAYLWQMIYPAGLAVLYPLTARNSSPWVIGGSAVVLGLISVAVTLGRRKHPYLLTGWLWYAGMLVPVIGLIQVGDQARADRYTYLPQIGLYILAAWGAAELFGKSRAGRILLTSVALAAVAALMVAAHAQTAYWRDSFTLWTHTLACTTNNGIAQSNLGHALSVQGKFDEAIEHYRTAAALTPKAAEPHYNLGDALAKEGRIDEAIREFEKAIELKPGYAKAHYNLGIALASQGKLDEAIPQYEAAVRINPDHIEARYNLANSLATGGKLEEAVAQYKELLARRPDMASAENNLANVLANERKIDEAISHYKRALELKPDYVRAWFNLGNALAKEGKIPEAISALEKALALAEAQNEGGFAQVIRSRLDSYKSAIKPP